MSAVITNCRNSWQLLLIRLNGCTSIQPYQCLCRVGVRQGLQFSSIFSAYKIVASIMHPTQPTDDAWKHLRQIAGPVALLWFCDGNQKLATMTANGWDYRRNEPPQQCRTNSQRAQMLPVTALGVELCFAERCPSLHHSQTLQLFVAVI